MIHTASTEHMLQYPPAPALLSFPAITTAQPIRKTVRLTLIIFAAYTVHLRFFGLRFAVRHFVSQVLASDGSVRPVQAFKREDDAKTQKEKHMLFLTVIKIENKC